MIPVTLYAQMLICWRNFTTGC